MQKAGIQLRTIRAYKAAGFDYYEAKQVEVKKENYSLGDRVIHQGRSGVVLYGPGYKGSYTIRYDATGEESSDIKASALALCHPARAAYEECVKMGFATKDE